MGLITANHFDIDPVCRISEGGFRSVEALPVPEIFQREDAQCFFTGTTTVAGRDDPGEFDDS